MVLSMVLYMVLSDTLADRCMARRQQVRWKGCFTFTYLWLATSWFVSGGCACYLSFRFLSLGGSEYLKQEGAEGAGKDFIHTGRQTKNATEDESNLPHMLAS